MCLKRSFASETLDTCRSLVEDDYGITFLPSTLNSKGDDDKVKFYPLASKLCFRQLVLVARSDRAKRFHLSGSGKYYAKILINYTDGVLAYLVLLTNNNLYKTISKYSIL